MTPCFHHTSGKAVSKQDVGEALLQRNVSRARLNVEQKSLHLAEIGPRWEDIAEAEAALIAQKRDLELLRNQLEDAELKSPAHSLVFRWLMEPGDMASPQKAIVPLAVLDPKWVRAYVAETEPGLVRSGMDAVVHTDSHPDEGVSGRVSFVSPVAEFRCCRVNQSLHGRVSFVSTVAEFTPKTVQTSELCTSLVHEVRVYVDDARDRLRLGMPATVSFPTMP